MKEAPKKEPLKNYESSLTTWNKGKLGKPGQVPVIAEGGGNLQFSSHLNLDSVTLSANSVHFDSSGGPTHSLGIDKDGCLAHTVKNNLGTTTNFAPVCFNHGIKTNSIAPESSSIIPTAVFDTSCGICSAPPLLLTGMSGDIRIPSTTNDEHTVIMANSTLWFAVKNDQFLTDGRGQFFLQFSLPASSATAFESYPDASRNFIYPGGITVMWTGGVADNCGGCSRLFGLQNPNPHDISFYAYEENFSPCISWIYFTPYSGS